MLLIKVWILITGVALFIHLLAGHSVQHIFSDVTGGTVLLLGIPAAIFSFRMVLQTCRVPKHIWERNRSAALIAKKINKRKELNVDEKARYHAFLHSGILTASPYIYKGKWHLYVQLSERVINDTFSY